METRVVNILHQRGAQITRRASLLTVGIAGWTAALAQPLTAFGKRKGSNTSKKLKQAKKRCQQDLATCEAEAERCVEQRRQCFSLFILSCEGDPACLAEGRRCCAALAECNVAPFLRCLA